MTPPSLGRARRPTERTGAAIVPARHARIVKRFEIRMLRDVFGGVKWVVGEGDKESVGG